MKNLTGKIIMGSLTGLFLFGLAITGCKKDEDPIKFPKGSFPDTVQNISSLNSPYDDYNLDIHEISGNMPLIFSSNRKSSGGQFDLEQGLISFTFSQETGEFKMEAGMINDSFLEKLINAAKTPGNDFGPYRLYSSYDGYEYLLLSSVSSNGDLDLVYLKNRPVFSSVLPEIDGPHPISLLNTSSDDAYISFNSKLDSAYFTSNLTGNFDIYLHSLPEGKEISWWFDQVYSSSVAVDSVNGPNDDKCPMVFRKILIFTSDRPGGLGGFDLYYSRNVNGKWTSPVNFGPGINTASDEYRPVIGFHPDFTNLFMMFSSNRPGGKGGFDLYFTGVEF